MATFEQEAREHLTELLPKAAHRHVDAILKYFNAGVIKRIDVLGTRTPIEVVSAYGLEFALDAAGKAASVHFPNGAEVVAE